MSSLTNPEPGPGEARIWSLGAMLFGALAGWLDIQSVDFFWHSAAGRWMLAHGRILRHDPFRFTSGEVPWVDHEWGFQWLMAYVESAFGLPGLIVARSALIAALSLVLFRSLERHCRRPEIAAGLLAVVLLGARPRFFMRPELASFALFVPFFSLLSGWLDRRRGTGLGICLLTAIWANLHPGVLLVPPVMAAAWTGRRLQGREAGSSLWIAGATLSILANPWGWRVFLVPFEISRALSGLRATNPDWAGFLDRPQPLLACLALGYAWAVWRNEKGPAAVDRGLLFANLALFGLAFTGVRHQGYALVGMASHLARLWPSLHLHRWLRPVLGQVTVGASMLLVTVWFLVGRLAFPSISQRPGWGVRPGAFPEQAVTALLAFEGLGPIYNSPPFGGYLLWRGYPPRQVFIDTRNEVDPEGLQALARARLDGRAWAELLERWKIDGALLRYEPPRPVLGPDGRVEELRGSSVLLFPCDRFGLVAFDSRAMFLARRRPGRENRLAPEDLCFRPDDLAAVEARRQADPEWRARLEAYLRSIGSGPPSP